MNCGECQELMLEADPELLTGIGDEPIARHISACEVCRELASGILDATGAVRSAYTLVRPAPVPAPVRIRTIGRRAIWAVASLAAAAAVVIVVSGGSHGVDGRGIWKNLEPDMPTSSIAIEVPEGKNAIVFDTKNPKVSVVWIY
jgi:hypothetical protein